ncbi:DNA helicase MCM9 [Nematocida major]|uniref:DNA helicase MCM9 n=1 Tax=Nematocida major TaxID=1912982 RepID=UPI0020072C41|nr:DNA helicase MCM9 [Nematocida major]KAH9385552.1 DNA helicase MCM9 [Nematocida major]
MTSESESEGERYFQSRAHFREEHGSIKKMDVMEEYDKNPDETLRALSSASVDMGIYNIPCAYDLQGYPSASHYNKIVSVYGTVMKLGLSKFKVAGGAKTDYQEIKIQERSTVYLPRTINVQLFGALIGACKPGEVVRVTGCVEVLWRKAKLGQPVNCEYSIRALEISQQKPRNKGKQLELPESEYDLLMKVVDAYAPSLAGLRQSKLAMVLCTLGGQGCAKDTEREEGSITTEQMYQDSQSRNRTSSHILLVGRTGTGKSTLLAFAAKTVSPAICTTGNSCTSAGLTACATRENNDWMIEPGAIPQADKGLCCIDEFNALRKEEKSSILEAMEQQTITIAKAGILLKLDTRCTVVGAARHCTEPEGALQSLKLSAPLLSRFDLIVGLDDALATDREIAEKNIEKKGEERCAMFIRDLLEERKKIRVKLTGACKEVIEAYYSRQKEENNVSIRALESHMRLCEAYAKLLGRCEAGRRDGLMTALLLNSCLHTKKLWSYTLDGVIGSRALLESALDYIGSDLLGESACEV